MAALVAALVEGQHAFPKQKWVVRYSPLPTNPGVFKGIFYGIFKVSSISLSAPQASLQTRGIKFRWDRSGTMGTR